MEEWKEYKLGDFIKIKHGYAFEGKSISFDDNNIVLVTPGNFAIGGGFQEKKCKFFHSSYPSEYILNENDLIVTMTDLSKDGDTLGYSAKVPYSDTRIYLHNQRIGLVQFINSEVDKDFIYWFMRSPLYQKTVLSTSSGSTVKHTSPDRICGISVKLPPLPTQQKIAAILSSLDDKIELNNKINTNLEQQAQALFKNWFVDFEPFGGKMPDEWKEVEFRDVCENITDGVHNTVVDDPNGEYLLLSCKNIKGGVLTISSSERKINKETFEKLRKRTKLAKGDILLSSVGTVGEMYLLNETPDNYEFQRSVAIIKPNTSLISPAFLYESMLFQKDTIIHSAHGAVQQCIFISDVGDFTTILPTIDIIEKFTKIVQPMLDTITANQHVNSKLANIRDTLLSKLINGEIDV